MTQGWMRREGQVRIIAGRISGWLNNSEGEINGIVLHGGQRVRFSPNDCDRVLAIADIGSRVEVSTLCDPGGDTAANAVRIINLDSQQYATLSVSPTPNGPEASTDLCPPPGTAVPLAPTFTHHIEPSISKHFASDLWIPRNGVAEEIERARTALHLIQTMIAQRK
jgi:hypothetical protein